MLDTLFHNGLVVDGTGKPAYRGEVGIQNGRIAYMGKSSASVVPKAAEVVNLDGAAICPGIIDPHSHADFVIFRPDQHSLLEPLVLQGVTTFVGGNCGLSMAPLGRAHRREVQQYLSIFANADVESECEWSSVGQFLDVCEQRGLLMNMALLVPHGLLRIESVGTERRVASDEEIGEMSRALQQGVEEGAFGLSTGLQYFPGSNSDSRELHALGKALSTHDGIFASHLRSYSNTLPQAMEEVIDVARRNDIRAQISHIFQIPDFGPAGPVMRGLIRLASSIPEKWMPPLPLHIPLAQRLKELVNARAAGVEVGMDVMPTTTAFTFLVAFLPPWALEGTREEVIARLADHEQRARMLRDIESGTMRWPHVEDNSWSLNMIKLMGWHSMRLMGLRSEKNRRYENMTILQIAQERGQAPFDAACDLLVEERGQVLVFLSLAQPDDSFTERSMLAPLGHPEVAISTDTLITRLGRPSPLFHGCYARFLSRYVFDKKLLTLEAAVRKMTAVPAEQFRIEQRGQLKVGYHADILVFDSKTVSSSASFDNPDAPPTGIRYVYINGQKVVDHGRVLVTKAGQVLRKK